MVPSTVTATLFLDTDRIVVLIRKLRSINEDQKELFYVADLRIATLGHHSSSQEVKTE